MNNKGKTMIARTLLAVLLLSCGHMAFCQNFLSRSCNLFQVGDSVSKQKVDYVNAGDGGNDAVWDFSNLETTGAYYIKYDTLSSNLFVGYDAQKRYFFQAYKDSLMFLGFETPLLRMDYQKSQLMLPFPLQMEQTFHSSYKGEGRYCGTDFERSFGTVCITADGYGTIILSEQDTLPNTLRIYTVNTEAIRLNADSCLNDSDNLKQVITEHYQWYARGYRYPVFETITSSSYDNMNHVATQQYAYRCPPEIQNELSDLMNEGIREEDMAAGNGNGTSNGHSTHEESNPNGSSGGFSYDVQHYDNQAIIIYDLEQDSHVHVMVVDVMGMIHYDEQQCNGAGTGYTMNFDCSGLRHGQYIIYINVNGIIYSTKIQVK